MLVLFVRRLEWRKVPEGICRVGSGDFISETKFHDVDPIALMGALRTVKMVGDSVFTDPIGHDDERNVYAIFVADDLRSSRRTGGLVGLQVELHSIFWGWQLDRAVGLRGGHENPLLFKVARYVVLHGGSGNATTHQGKEGNRSQEAAH